ncbi:hypothetical protein ACULNC_25350 [Shigella flexneri]
MRESCWRIRIAHHENRDSIRKNCCYHRYKAGQRIDNFLRTQLKGVPKSMIYRILRKGECG